MKDKERYLLTVHDELFCDLIVPYDTTKTLERKSRIDLTANSSLFTIHEFILWIILVDFKLKNPSINYPISLSYIHKKYRGKRVGKTEVMSQSDLDAYKRALNGLQRKRINMNTGKGRLRYKQNNIEVNNGRIFKITNITEKSNGDLVFEYTLGNYGEVIRKCKRYSDMLPINILKTSYKQNMKLYIGIYISRLIFINRRKQRNEIVVTIDSIMKHIRLHDSSGVDSGKNLYELMNEDHISKYSKLKLFNSYLIEVLEMLKFNSTIYDYDMSLADGWKCQINLKKV